MFCILFCILFVFCICILYTILYILYTKQYYFKPWWSGKYNSSKRGDRQWKDKVVSGSGEGGQTIRNSAGMQMPPWWLGRGERDEGSPSGRTRSPGDDSGLHDHWSVTSGQRGRTGLTGSTWAQGLGGRVGQSTQHGAWHKVSCRCSLLI